MNGRVFIATMAVMLCLPSVKAQDMPQMSQYYVTPTLYNPGAAGRSDYGHVGGASRLQWLGIDGAPKTFYLQSDIPLQIASVRAGAGAGINYESIGLFRNVAVQLQAAWWIRVGRKGRLSIAVQGGVLNTTFLGSRVFIPVDDTGSSSTDEPDESNTATTVTDDAPMTDLSGHALTVGIGTWLELPRFRMGVSAVNLTAPTVRFEETSFIDTGGGDENSEGTATVGSSGYAYDARRTLFVMAEGNIPLTGTLFEMIPSTMLKTDFTTTRVDITGRLRYNNMLSIGAGWRPGDAAIIILGFEYHGFHAAYSYDWPLGAVTGAAHGSHELTAGYSFKLNLGGTPRQRRKSIRIL